MWFVEEKTQQRNCFFDQFDKSHWNGMHNCWLSSKFVAGIPRTNNGLECHNSHVKHAFAEILLPANELLGVFITWVTNESRRQTNSHARALTEHVAGKTDAKVVRRIHYVWREGQKEPFDFYQKNLIGMC